MKNILKKIITYILTLEAKLVLKKYNPKIVAVTGSVGKTSTKDAIYTALLPFVHVRKSAKSYNSDIGIPLTILGVPNAWSNILGWIKNILKGMLLIIFKRDYPSFLVLEIGADRPGEIKSVCKWIHPDISVITRIGDVPVHVEFYKSVADVVREKSYLAQAVKKEGVLILNADDEDVISFKEFSDAKVMTFGFKNNADVSGSYPQIKYDEHGNISGMTMKVDVAGSSLPVILNNTLGNHHLYPILASFAVAYAENLNLIDVSNSFKIHQSPPGRMNIIEGVCDSVIIDDTYNASPIALEEGLNILGEVECKGKKIAVLGDMLELGKFSVSEHKRLGAIAKNKADILVCVGIRAKEYGMGAHEEGMRKNKIYFCENAMVSGSLVKTLIKKGDCVFVKGSQGMRMERAVEILMAYPEKKHELLVRQEEEWLKR